MPVVLCYGDSNTHGTKPMTDLATQDRYGTGERWTGVLRRELGQSWTVIDEGLPGRTTVHDDPIEGEHKNGRRYLLPCLESHGPVDIVTLMLGTNDLKARFSLPASDIAIGIEILLEIIIASGAGPGGAAPRVLLIAPPPLARLDLFADMFTGGAEKSRRLAGLYGAIAARYDVGFLDAGSIIHTSDADGIHFDPEVLEPLGKAVAASLRRLAA